MRSTPSLVTRYCLPPVAITAYIVIGPSNGRELKGRAFYWRTLARSNRPFLSIGRDLAYEFPPPKRGRSTFLERRPCRLRCGLRLVRRMIEHGPSEGYDPGTDPHAGRGRPARRGRCDPCPAEERSTSRRPGRRTHHRRRR